MTCSSSTVYSPGTLSYAYCVPLHKLCQLSWPPRRVSPASLPRQLPPASRCAAANSVLCTLLTGWCLPHNGWVSVPCLPASAPMLEHSRRVMSPEALARGTAGLMATVPSRWANTTEVTLRLWASARYDKGRGIAPFARLSQAHSAQRKSAAHALRQCQPLWCVQRERRLHRSHHRPYT